MDTMNVADAAKYVGRSVSTMQRLDREGALVASRTGTNRRYYRRAQLDAWLHRATEESCKMATVVYCRVSSPAQKPDLANQRNALEEFCIARGIADPEFIEEVGGGMNFGRKRFLILVDRICGREIGTLVVAHRDRLTRFGFELFEHLCQAHGCSILVLNSEKLSPEREMVEDLMTIVHCFSSRLYGLRNYRRALKDAIGADTQPQDQA